MEIIEGHDYTFPVVGYDRAEVREGIVTPKQIYGTAFYIGNDLFLTAGHTILNAQSSNDTIGVAIIEGTGYVCYESESVDILQEFDVGLIKTVAHSERPRSHKWVMSRVPSLYDVSASGFPYAMNVERKTIGSRSFKGHIVSMTMHQFEDADVRVYELSFQCPIGLSGSPLITARNDHQIAGIVVGNHSTEMIVFTHRERISEETESIIERYQALQLGIAVQTIQLLDTYSNLLDSNFREHLESQSLIGDSIL